MTSGVRRRWPAILRGVVCVAAEPMTVRLDAGVLRVAAPGLHFLSGSTLERLHNGSSVVFTFQLSLLTNAKAATRHRSGAQFAVSYDLWEEKFAVTRLDGARKSASHLSAAAAEGWCLDHLTLPFSGLGENTPFWVRLDLRAEETEPNPAEEDPMSLTRLVEMFSRAPRQDRPQWREEAGPLRLSDLRKP